MNNFSFCNNPRIFNGTPHEIKFFAQGDTEFNRKDNRFVLKNKAAKATIIPQSGTRPLKVNYNAAPFIIFQVYGIDIRANDFARRIETLYNFEQYDIIIVSEAYAKAASSAGLSPTYIDRLYVIDEPIYDEGRIVGCHRLRHYMALADPLWYTYNYGTSPFSAFLAQKQKDFG
ncbi:MAG: hypothetical protein K6G65_10970 [Lachnospiraceae bacterium]|nr:hypothetical protein [Lachnospiraceae bacterium]